MTGFGQAVLGRGADKWVVEIRSLNHRYLEYSSKLPQALTPLEGHIKSLVQSHVRRGKVSVFITSNGAESLRENVVIDEGKIEFYYRNLRRIAHHLKIEPRISLSDLVALPNIFLADKASVKMEEHWPRIQKALRKAIVRLIQMKVREGAALKKDLLWRVGLIAKCLARVKRLATSVVVQYQERLKTRVAELTKGLDLDSEKLAREIAIMADRSDVTEEVVRLENHLRLFRSTLEEREEVGKKLDFITQEMNREANTIASKSVSFAISREVVRIKTEVEKIREQVQNIE